MTRVAAVVVALTLVGCGSKHFAGPADVVRAWSMDLNKSDDAGAAALFARDAEVVQGGAVATLHTRADAKTFNSSLPCAGRITKLDVRNELVTATFLLGQRPGHSCDAPGGTATAVFRVRDGRIVLWHQVGSAPATPPV